MKSILLLAASLAGAAYGGNYLWQKWKTSQADGARLTIVNGTETRVSSLSILSKDAAAKGMDLEANAATLVTLATDKHATLVVSFYLGRRYCLWRGPGIDNTETARLTIRSCKRVDVEKTTR